MPSLSGDIKLPVVGSIPKKQAAIAGGVVVVIVGIGFYRKRQANQAALAAVTDDGTLTEGTDAFGSTVPVGPGDLSGGGAVTSGGDPVPAPIVLQNPGIVTNNDWKEAGSALDLGGIDSSVIAAALSRVLGGVALTQAQLEIFQEVSGEIGYPPQGYPPPKLTTTMPGNPPPTTTTKATYVTTGRFGLAAGHPVDVAYLTGLGYLKRVGNKYVFTGKGGLSANHPWGYDYAAGIGLIRKK